MPNSFHMILVDKLISRNRHNTLGDARQTQWPMGAMIWLRSTRPIQGSNTHPLAYLQSCSIGYTFTPCNDVCRVLAKIPTCPTKKAGLVVFGFQKIAVLLFTRVCPEFIEWRRLLGSRVSRCCVLLAEDFWTVWPANNSQHKVETSIQLSRHCPTRAGPSEETSYRMVYMRDDTAERIVSEI